MIVGFTNDEEGQSFEAVIKMKEVEGVQKSNSILKEDGATSSHEGILT